MCYTNSSCLVVSSFHPVFNDALCATVAIDTSRVTQSDGRPSPHDSAPKLALCVSVALDAGCHFHSDWMASRDAASESIILDGCGLVLSTLSLSGETCLRVVTSHPVPFPSHRCRKSHVTSLWGHLVASRQERPHPHIRGTQAKAWGWRQAEHKQPEP